MLMRVLLLVAFVAVPLAEVYFIIQVGQVIGGWWTLALLIAIGALGSWLVRREGRRVWQALTGALGNGQLPDREVLDAGLVLVGGTLMLTPGFLSDIVGLFVILPPTRPLARRVLTRLLGRRLQRQMGRVGMPGGIPGGMRGGMPGGVSGGMPGQDRGPVVEGEVVDRDDRRP